MNPEKALTFQIRTLENLIERKMNYIIAKNVHDDITPMHSMILAYLHRNEGHDIYQKDIESRFDITRSTVTSILKLMEHKGYIRREGVASGGAGGVRYHPKGARGIIGFVKEATRSDSRTYGVISFQHQAVFEPYSSISYSFVPNKMEGGFL